MMMKILMSIVAITMLVQLASAADHTVGAPNGGWDTSTDLQSWASSQTFTVGDNIVFRYTPNHNVLEVSKNDYDSCSTDSAITTNSLTPTTIELSDAGSRYFICGTPGHCDQGMKVEIKTVGAASAPPTTTTPSSPTPPESTPSSPPSPPSSSDAPSPPASSSDVPSPPASSTPGTPAKPTPTPSPSSAETVKTTAVSMVGLGFLIMMI